MLMNILLIKLKEPHKQTQKVCVVPPIGLWSIRTNLQQLANVDICDMHLGQNLNSFLNKEYDYIGISCQFSIQHKEYIKVSKLLSKRQPDALKVVGGFHGASVPPLPEINYVCKGSGELFFHNLLNKEMTKFYHPEFLHEEIVRYWNKGVPHDLSSKTSRWASIETSRGCYRKCGFCGVTSFWGKYEPFDVDWVGDYLNYLVTEHGIEELFIEDDNFAYDQERFLKIIKLFKKYKLYWSTPNGIEINTIKNHLAKLKETGCWRLCLPFETGTHKTAKLMRLGNKWIDFETAKKVVNTLNNEEIQTCGFFIIGYPGETKDDIYQTLEFANELPLKDRHIYIATPYPGTELYKVCKEKGFLTSDGENLYEDLLYSKSFISTNEFTNKEVEEIKQIDREKALARRKKFN